MPSGDLVDELDALCDLRVLEEFGDMVQVVPCFACGGVFYYSGFWGTSPSRCVYCGLKIPSLPENFTYRDLFSASVTPFFPDTGLVVPCVCEACEHLFLVKAGIEFSPRFCCNCGESIALFPDNMTLDDLAKANLAIQDVAVKLPLRKSLEELYGGVK
jgi:hypothetical protein